MVLYNLTVMLLNPLLSYFIDYKPMECKIEGLGVHNSVGTGTLKYTVLDDNGDKVNLLINNQFMCLQWIHA